jgi:ATP-binding cassette subfamily C protein
LSIFGNDSKTVISTALKLLDKRRRKKLILVTFVQALLSVLDILSVAIIGIVTAIALSGIQSQDTDGVAAKVLQFLKLENYSFQAQVAFLGITAALFMILKTFFSAFMMNRILQFLSHTASTTSRSLLSKLVSKPWEFLKQLDSQKILFSVTTGVYALVIGALGSTVQIVTEISLILIMIIALIVVDPIITIGAFLFFALIMLIQNIVLNKKSQVISFKHSTYTIDTNNQILNIFRFYRELYVRNAVAKTVDEVGSNLDSTMQLNAKMKFLPNISRYVMESSLVLGALLLAATQFILEDAITAITTLTIFLAASSRIAPSLIRLQNALLGLSSAVGGSRQVLEIIGSMSSADNSSSAIVELGLTNESSESKSDPAEIEFRNVSFNFSDEKSKFLFLDLNFRINQGKFVAIVGPSGSGKTTLVDLMLGLYSPIQGQILIQGKSPRQAITENPKLFGYVPQEARLLNSSILDNLNLGLSSEISTGNKIEKLLERLNLSLLSRGDGPIGDTLVGENGVLLSGGQRQRLNLARALTSEPMILILDEATSALDYETERIVIELLQSLKGKATVVAIAHRISTIMHADEILYVNNGKIEVSKSLNELKAKVPGIEEEAKLISSKVLES